MLLHAELTSSAICCDKSVCQEQEFMELPSLNIILIRDISCINSNCKSDEDCYCILYNANCILSMICMSVKHHLKGFVTSDNLVLLLSSLSLQCPQKVALPFPPSSGPRENLWYFLNVKVLCFAGIRQSLLSRTYATTRMNQ